jgi:hypothetical protein
MGTTRGYSRRDGEWQLDRATKQLGGWLTGYGLLSLNIGLFLIAATALFMLNLYQDPRNIDVFQQLRFWALLIIFHAVAVTIVWIMSWALRAGQSEPSMASKPAANNSGPIPIAASGQTTSRSRFSPTVSTPVILDTDEETEHFWRRRSTAIWRKHEPGKQDTWSWATTEEAEVTHTWPDGDSFEVAPYGPTFDAVPLKAAELEDVDGEVHLDIKTDVVVSTESQKAEAGPEPTDSVIDPLRFASRQQESNGSVGEDAVLTRWLWVEAAAAAWLAQREDGPETAGDDASKPFLPPTDGEPPEALP